MTSVPRPTTNPVQAALAAVAADPPTSDPPQPVPLFALDSSTFARDPLYDRIGPLPPGPHGIPDFTAYFQAAERVLADHPSKQVFPAVAGNTPTAAAAEPPSPLIIAGVPFKWAHPAHPESDISSQASSYITVSEVDPADVTPVVTPARTPAATPAPLPTPARSPNPAESRTPAASRTPLPSNAEIGQSSPLSSAEEHVARANEAASSDTPAPQPADDAGSFPSAANPVPAHSSSTAAAKDDQPAEQSDLADVGPVHAEEEEAPETDALLQPHDQPDSMAEEGVALPPLEEARYMKHAIEANKVSNFQISRRSSAASAPALLPSWMPPTPPTLPPTVSPTPEPQTPVPAHPPSEMQTPVPSQPPPEAQTPVPTQSSTPPDQYEAEPSAAMEDELSTPIVAKSAAAANTPAAPRPVTLSTDASGADHPGTQVADSEAEDGGLWFDYASTATPQSRRVTLASVSGRPSSAGAVEVEDQVLGPAGDSEADDGEAADGKATDNEADNETSTAAEVTQNPLLSSAAGFSVLGRSSKGVLQCDADGRFFKLCVNDVHKQAVGEVAIQCDPNDILVDMRNTFGPITEPRSIGVQTDLKATPQGRAAPSESASRRTSSEETANLPAQPETDSSLHGTPFEATPSTRKDSKRSILSPALNDYDTLSAATFSVAKQPTLAGYESTSASPSTSRRPSTDHDVQVTPVDIGVQADDEEIRILGEYSASTATEHVAVSRTLRELLPPVNARESVGGLSSVISEEVVRQAAASHAPRPITLPPEEQQASNDVPPEHDDDVVMNPAETVPAEDVETDDEDITAGTHGANDLDENDDDEEAPPEGVADPDNEDNDNQVQDIAEDTTPGTEATAAMEAVVADPGPTAPQSQLAEPQEKTPQSVVTHATGPPTTGILPGVFPGGMMISLSTDVLCRGVKITKDDVGSYIPLGEYLQRLQAAPIVPNQRLRPPIHRQSGHNVDTASIAATSAAPSALADGGNIHSQSQTAGDVAAAIPVEPASIDVISIPDFDDEVENGCADVEEEAEAEEAESDAEEKEPEGEEAEEEVVHKAAQRKHSAVVQTRMQAAPPAERAQPKHTGRRATEGVEAAHRRQTGKVASRRSLRSLKAGRRESQSEVNVVKQRASAPAGKAPRVARRSSARLSKKTVEGEQDVHDTPAPANPLPTTEGEDEDVAVALETGTAAGTGVQQCEAVTLDACETDIDPIVDIGGGTAGGMDDDDDDDDHGDAANYPDEEEEVVEEEAVAHDDGADMAQEMRCAAAARSDVGSMGRLFSPGMSSHGPSVATLNGQGLGLGPGHANAMGKTPSSAAHDAFAGSVVVEEVQETPTRQEPALRERKLSGRVSIEPRATDAQLERVMRLLDDGDELDMGMDAAPLAGDWVGLRSRGLSGVSGRLTGVSGGFAVRLEEEEGVATGGVAAAAAYSRPGLWRGAAGARLSRPSHTSAGLGAQSARARSSGRPSAADGGDRISEGVVEERDVTIGHADGDELMLVDAAPVPERASFGSRGSVSADCSADGSADGGTGAGEEQEEETEQQGEEEAAVVAGGDGNDADVEDEDADKREAARADKADKAGVKSRKGASKAKAKAKAKASSSRGRKRKRGVGVGGVPADGARAGGGKRARTTIGRGGPMLREVAVGADGRRRTGEGVRRSTRQRFPVLKYWKNETVQYERRNSQMLPTVSQVIIDVAEQDPRQAWAPSRR